MAGYYFIKRFKAISWILLPSALVPLPFLFPPFRNEKCPHLVSPIVNKKAKVYIWAWILDHNNMSSFWGFSFLQTGHLCWKEKRQRASYQEGTDIIGEQRSLQTTYCTGKHKMSFHAGFCQCHSALPEWTALLWFIFHSSVNTQYFSAVMDKISC